MEHGKKYDTDVEESFRMKIFTENKHKIATHNKLYSTGQKPYKLKMNKYGDMVSMTENNIIVFLLYAVYNVWV